jgi:small-conductance mechanosensitive channel
VASRLAQTVFWTFLLTGLLRIVNDVIFGKAGLLDPDGSLSWRAKVPKLFRDLVRAVVVVIGLMVIYSWVWGHEIKGALTALGVGSVVIGLALQEPLGNIVSGLMLLFERPLDVGDWVSAQGVIGKVVEINWRSVHIETATREIHVIPNVSLYKGAFSNLSRPTTVRTEVIPMGFSYDDPPNRVKEVMLDMLRGTPGVLAEPAPAVRTVDYADFSVTYRLIFSVARQDDLGVVRDAVMTRLWYVVRREGLTIPFPIAMEYAPGESPSPPAPPPAELLREHARFRAALPAEGAPAPRVVDFAAGETVQTPEGRFEGFALILKGEAVLLAPDAAGSIVEVGELGPGECFGDQLGTGVASAHIGIRALTDLKVMVFESGAIDHLLQRQPALAAEIGDAIESRRQAAHSARLRK